MINSFNIGQLILNFVGYHVPKTFDSKKNRSICEQMIKTFSLAFPDKEPPTVNIWTGRTRGQDGTFITFATSFANVSASHIVTAAIVNGWKVDELSLGNPWYVGFETDEMLHPIKFEDVPEARKEDFLPALPAFLTEKLDPSHQIEIVDLWELQSRVASNALEI